MGLSAADSQRLLAEPERLALRAQVPEPPQPAGLEDLRPPHRWLDERRFPQRNNSRRPQFHAVAWPAHSQHARQPQQGRSRLQRQALSARRWPWRNSVWPRWLEANDVA